MVLFKYKVPVLFTFFFIFGITKCDYSKSSSSPFDLSNSSLSEDFYHYGCSPPRVDNGIVQVRTYRGQSAALITCKENYTLIGKGIVLMECFNGEWKFRFNNVLPKCEMRCSSPPYLEHGDINFEKKLEDEYSPSGSYLEETIARYTCKEGYILEPLSSSVRVCQKGHWTGTDGFCKPTDEVRCNHPPMIENGYIQPSFPIEYSPISPGQEVLYACLNGYHLIGSHKIRCTEGGVWLPEAPSCHKDEDFLPNIECANRPLLDPTIHARIEIKSISSDTVEIGCKANYQNILAPCQNMKLFCKRGKWDGLYPRCVEAHSCVDPPAIPYAVALNRNFETSFNTDGHAYYPLDAQISYQCLKGYILDGYPVITCQPNGCWEAGDYWPTCVRAKEDYYDKINNIHAILVSSVTGAGVLGLLLIFCLVAACGKKRALARAVSLSPAASSGATRHPPDVVNDHTVLLQHPDRLALIAFAEGVQNSQNNLLPSYDEATRDRSTLIQVSRLQIQRPHWPNLALCRASGRSRGSPNIDNGHQVARHGSFVSHTPSMRSGGESMGSTETVTISEGSTNVTLDTASSHSAVSQNPSCRGHCGSLASFDGCSIANTEGIPLLEANELEENQGGSNDVANPTIPENVGPKNSIQNTPVVTNTN